MASQTVRYYAVSQQAYARALLELTIYARTHEDNFSAGPLKLDALEHQGLTVTGPDLAGIREVLDKIPGLVQEP